MKNIVIIACCRSGHNFVRQMIQSWSPELLIINFEDVQPQDYAQAQKSIIMGTCQIDSDFSSHKINWANKTFNIIVFRDLLNWWASYLKWIPKPLSDYKRDLAFKIWTSQLEEAYTGKYLNYSLLVGYEIFHSSRSFRLMVCDTLKGEYNEDMLDIVTPQGKGSSFDGLIKKGFEMATDFRYKQIMESDLRGEYIRGLRENPDAIEAYKRFLPLTVDQENVCNRGL